MSEVRKLKLETALLQKKLQIAEAALREVIVTPFVLEGESPKDIATDCLKKIASLQVSDISTIITFEEFERAVNNLKEFFQEQDKLDAVLKVLSPSGTGVVEFGNKFIDDFIRLGEAGLKDQDNWFGWFVFDNNFGARKLTLKFNQVEYVIANEKDFYDVFVKLSNYKQ